jgi:hypothetical protein
MKETKDAATILCTPLTSAKNGLSSAKNGLCSAKNGGATLVSLISAKMPFFAILEVVKKKK